MKNVIRTALTILSLSAGLLAGCDVPPDQATTPDQTTPVAQSLINNGGGTGASWWCGDDGLCTCEGGTLSSDCWDLSQYCIDSYQCRVSAPYLCYCHWKAVRQNPRTTITGINTTTVLKAIP
jgi:hypothetical protein